MTSRVIKKSVYAITIFGTRPEAIKLAPILIEFDQQGIKDHIVCVTGQHRKMLDQMLKLFNLSSDHDLDIMLPHQTLEKVTSKILVGLQKILNIYNPGLVIVQGDTTTALIGALAGFYQKIPVVHVEAGLRTNDIYNPFPEEMNRRLISQIASIHFAPTKQARENLIKNGIPDNTIFVTGNTVIDSLFWVLRQNLKFKNNSLARIDFKHKRTILVTTHRRENLGEGMEGIFASIGKLANKHRELQFIFPVHLNPSIKQHAKKTLSKINNVLLLEPLEYTDLVRVLQLCYFVMTDSGGIQEEAPSLGKPVLVLRNTTERQEGIEAGTAKLVGTSPDKIYETAKELIDNKQSYQKMASTVNPYGDGTASKQIVTILRKIFF